MAANGDADAPATSDKSVESPDVVDKYKTAAEIANAALAAVRAFAYDGMAVHTLCALADAQIEKKAGAVYNKARTETGEKLDKGVAFPTCVAVAPCAAHFSPASLEEGGVLKAGEVYTVHTAAHIDGYSAMVAGCGVVRAGKGEEEGVVEGRAADAMIAAWTAASAALRVMRPGRGNYEVTDVVESVAKDFGVSAMEGVLSHNVKRYVVDGSKVIMNRRDVDGGTSVDEWVFEENEVYALDVVMSTGEGKAKAREGKGNVYKRCVDKDYKLKMKASRATFSEISKRFPTMPFTMRALEDPMKARLGLTEMLGHELVTPYPVLYERDGETVARVAVTVLVLPSQTLPITVMDAPPARSEKEVVDQAVKDLLAIDISSKKKKKKGGAKAKATDAAEPAPMEM
jgi:curved DNA binding protein